MSTVFFELSDVLTQLLKAYNLTEAELSRKVNLPRATINRLTTGKTPDPKASTLDAIANYFNISVDQLLGKQPVNFNHKVSQSSSSILRIPIIDWSETRLWSKIISNLKPENHKEWVTTDICNGTNLFCVKVNSDSMWPNFEIGTLLIIDPEKKPINRSFVLTHIHDRDEIIFRQLIIDGQYKILKALNPIFPSIEVQSNDKIIGSVIETRCNYN